MCRKLDERQCPQSIDNRNNCRSGWYLQNWQDSLQGRIKCRNMLQCQGVGWIFVLSIADHSLPEESRSSGDAEAKSGSTVHRHRSDQTLGTGEGSLQVFWRIPVQSVPHAKWLWTAARLRSSKCYDWSLSPARGASCGPCQLTKQEPEIMNLELVDVLRIHPHRFL